MWTQERIARKLGYKILMSYRVIPQSTTGMSPAQLLLGRSIRMRLDLLIPNVREKVEHRQLQQKMLHDRSIKRKTFKKGHKVHARNFGTCTGQKWIPAVIEEETGPVSFMVKLQDNCIVRRHLETTSGEWINYAAKSESVGWRTIRHSHWSTTSLSSQITSESTSNRWELTSTDPNISSARENDQSSETESAEVSPNQDDGTRATPEDIDHGASQIKTVQNLWKRLKLERLIPNNIVIYQTGIVITLNLCIHSWKWIVLIYCVVIIHGVLLNSLMSSSLICHPASLICHHPSSVS